VAIVVTCGHCHLKYKVPDGAAGRNGKCPRCREDIVVPAKPDRAPGNAASKSSYATPAARQRPLSKADAKARPASTLTAPPITTQPVPLPAADEPPIVAELVTPATPQFASEPPPARIERARLLLGAFQGPAESVAVSSDYKLGIVMVLLALVVMLSLPILVFYLVPLSVKVFLALLLVKPLLAPSMRYGQPRSLTRRGEPLLFTFVDRICDAIGAPRPSRIDVDCQVNASAGFRRGIWSMLHNDLVLTFGLPLVAGLDVRQFASVLAHEFGHFSQGSAMRLDYLLRLISIWLARVVYGRDEWDRRLAQFGSVFNSPLWPIVQTARACFWLTRQILRFPMMFGLMVCGFLTRQMEFDADGYQVRLAGSDVFEPTMRRIYALDVATNGAYADLDVWRKEGRLGDNLPLLIVANVKQIPAEVSEQIDKQIENSVTSLFDTHPSHRTRIENALDQRAPGIFHLQQPATWLFSDFAALSKTATFDFYRQVFGGAFKLSDMHSTERLLARREKEDEENSVLGRYFQGTFNSLRAMTLPGPWLDDPVDLRAATARLQEARQRVLGAAPAYRAAWEKLDEADTLLLEAGQADALLSLRLRVKPGDFKALLLTPAAAMQARANALARREQLAPHLAVLEKAAGERLYAALEMLVFPQVAAKIESAKERLEECGPLLLALSVVNRQLGSLVELRNMFAILATLISRMERNRENAGLMGSIERHSSQLIAQVRAMQHELSLVRYPLEHAAGTPTLAEYVLPRSFTNYDFFATLDATQELLRELPRIYVRFTARLAALAEQVETALGLPLLPEPPKREKPKAT